MIENFHYGTYFPYPRYRNNQETLIREIERSARIHKNILLVAPNGTGKTVIALSSLLPVAEEKDLKIVYLCRTHSQSDRVIQELTKINKSINILGISLRGRTEMCLNPALSKMRISPSESMSICKEYRSFNRCVHYRNLSSKKDDLFGAFPELFLSPLSAEELIEYSREHALCPYFLAKSLLKEMRVVVCNYQWVLNPDILYGFLRLIDRKLGEVILIIDECHNIIDVATDVSSQKLVPNFLTKCEEYMTKLRFDPKYVKFVRITGNYLQNKKKGGARSFGEEVIDPTRLMRKFCTALKLKNIKAFKKFILKLGAVGETAREIAKEKHMKGVDLRIDYVKVLCSFWVKWFEKSGSAAYFFCVSVRKSNNRKYVALEIISLDPREILVPIFKRVYSSLCLTGTVNPSVFKSLTGLNYRFEGKGYKELSAKSPFQSRNICAMITEGVSTAKADRNPHVFKKIIKKLYLIINNTPANVGIFCASYSILNSLMMYGLSKAVKLSGKKLFMEESGLSASENALMVEDFKSLAGNSKEGAVLLGVCGGRNSEGEDYPSDFMNSVVVVGIPYHMPTPQVQAKIDYYDAVFHQKGWLFGYLSPAMQRANQASGRPIRKLNDKGCIVFMDERFKQKVAWISAWVRKELKLVSDNRTLEHIISSFWER